MVDLFVPRSTWQGIVDELDRVAPNEGVLMPLAALRYRHGLMPWATKGLADIDELVLTHALPLPPVLQRNNATRVVALPQSDAWVNAATAPLLERHPHLRTCAFLHSHPFARDLTWPSLGGGDYEGHMLPLLARNRVAGLDTSFSLIAFRQSDSWGLSCFALTPAARIAHLGDMAVVGDEHPAVQRALAERSRPLTMQARYERHLAARRGWRWQSEPLFDGWRREVFTRQGERLLCFRSLTTAHAPLWFRLSGEAAQPLREGAFI